MEQRDVAAATPTLADLLRNEVRATNGYPHARYLTIEVRDADGPVLRARFTFEFERLQ